MCVLVVSWTNKVSNRQYPRLNKNSRLKSSPRTLYARRRADMSRGALAGMCQGQNPNRTRRAFRVFHFLSSLHQILEWCRRRPHLPHDLYSHTWFVYCGFPGSRVSRAYSWSLTVVRRSRRAASTFWVIRYCNQTTTAQLLRFLKCMLICSHAESCPNIHLRELNPHMDVYGFRKGTNGVSTNGVCTIYVF